jgi:hypothetical protein
MLRLVHAQTVLGSLYVDDLDDGLPNKTAKRLGSTADPNAYVRDGYANSPKQPCYIPRTKPGDATVAGFIDLDETQRVTHSAFNGKIKGLQTAGLISVVSLVATDLATPVITAAQIDVPAAGDVTITGTGFLSVAPDITKVNLWGAGVGGTALAPGLTLTTAQIIATAPGAVGATSIVIDTLVNGALAAGDFVTVVADGRTSNTFTITV